MTSWVVLETVSRSDPPDPEVVTKAIQRVLSGATVFVPAAVSQLGSDRVVTYLMEGYCFVRHDRQPGDYFKLEGTKYIQNVLLTPGVHNRFKRLSLVSDLHVLQMREQLKKLTDQGIGVGDTVLITSGPYRDVTAVVLEDFPTKNKVQVHVRLRSKQALLTFPRSFLTVVSKSPISSIQGHLRSLCEWVKLVKPIFMWDAGIDRLQKTHTQYTQSVGFFDRAVSLLNLVLFPKVFPSGVARLNQRFLELTRRVSIPERYAQLTGFVGSCSDWDFDLSALEARLARLTWLESVLTRIQNLWDSLEQVSRDGAHMRQNVLVDGHNLAFRCLYAPGMADLSDSQGRPTGMILGVLRSLGALRRRFPEADIWVAWDGSSQRRKKQFGLYKANRKAHAVEEGFSPLAKIKQILPHLGVRQVMNPQEEADDVLATLVRGELKGDRNIILSTDRDLLQLVSETTSLLVPAVGSRNEVLFDPPMVQEVMGVAPDKVIELRAFYGDSSDNIPGVPRVPKKILRDLVQAWGSVEGVYRSGLAGLNKGQYERLRSAEPQVRINLALTTLVDVVVTTTPPEVDPVVATELLQELDINPSLLDSFIGSLPP